jgi:serine/threonine-protein kinase HipA
MKAEPRRSIHVHADWQGLDGPRPVGRLDVERLRGKEVFSFTYDPEWLRSGPRHLLDPELDLFPGPQYLKGAVRQNFGLFLDSSPDRWGRVMMRRREATLARLEGRDERPLFDSDFLLGVHDMQRMGGLRFSLSDEGPFLNDAADMACPPWTSLRELEHACLMLENDSMDDDRERLHWLNVLIAPGSSLGGARPKAGVMDERGGLWIAKFPSGSDDCDSGAWEVLARELAVAAGVVMPESMMMRLSSHHHTFLSRRFDRTADGGRIHFASAMTLLGHTDGHSAHEGASYLELADLIISSGADPAADLPQLWRRIAFNVCVSNTDDHLRNHGFLLTEKGWRLSPAYDINPVETGTGLSLNISETDNALDPELVMEVHQHFRLSPREARAVLSEIRDAVSKWQDVARRLGIPRSEMQRKERAFKSVKV